jgi:hypothetical protein
VKSKVFPVERSARRGGRRRPVRRLPRAQPPTRVEHCFSGVSDARRFCGGFASGVLQRPNSQPSRPAPRADVRYCFVPVKFRLADLPITRAAARDFVRRAVAE